MQYYNLSPNAMSGYQGSKASPLAKMPKEQSVWMTIYIAQMLVPAVSFTLMGYFELRFPFSASKCVWLRDEKADRT